MVDFRLEEEEDAHILCARGGPIIPDNFVGPLTSVPEFQSSFDQELKALQADLHMVSTAAFEDELSVDELRVFSEEELVEKAFKEASANVVQTDGSSQIPEEHSNKINREDELLRSSSGVAYLGSSRNGNDLVESHQSLNSSDLVVRDESSLESMSRQGANKGKNRSTTIELECGYIKKVEELAKIKQKQDEDRSKAELHSLKASAKISESPLSAADKDEKMRILKFISSSHKVKSLSTDEYVQVQNPETVLRIEIYHNKSSKKIQEFLVLGRQTLTELRDSIYCMTDQLMQKAGQHDPSGYFLIEDVLYNDMRDPSAIDYSESISSWLRNSREEAQEKWESITISGDLQKKQKSLVGNGLITQLPQFRAIEMHKARFCDLHFRLGSGYLYCHQGDCKHIFVIRDMRLIHPEDVQNRAAYPILTFQLRSRQRKCSVCRTFRATKVTVDDKWAEENPSYFCDSCYYLQHYLEDGSLLYDDFSVYDYHHEYLM